MFGEKCVFFLSQDDKARIPLGLPAAHKQSRVLMHMQYRIRLPDHDWVVAERHKLIPSVYARCGFINGKVSYQGPTFVCIRSGKHDKSESQTHCYDFEELLKLEVVLKLKKYHAVFKNSRRLLYRPMAESSRL